MSVLSHDVIRCFICSDVDVTMKANLNVSQTESVRCQINPEFGMRDSDISSSSSSDLLFSGDVSDDCAR